MSTKLEELDECFFGTVIDRDPADRIARKKHNKNGWRNGVTHPFNHNGKTYDVATAPNRSDFETEYEYKMAVGMATDKTVRTYETLKATIISGG